MTKRKPLTILALSMLLFSGTLGCDSGDGGNDESPAADTAASETKDGSSSTDPSDSTPADDSNSADTADDPDNDGSTTDAVLADVVEVSTSGSAGDYTFEVTVRSPDTGCEQYADWWEVISTDGELLHRRILAHSHTDEQPFTRSGGPVDVRESETVIVRAHMFSENADAGYGGTAMRGSPADGFEETSLEAGFASDVEESDPQPGDCAF